jgi:uncharacterized sulfatase
MVSTEAIGADRPNVLLILADDQGQHQISRYGDSFYETPNVNRLADEGMLFTNAYAACPVCSPTRASLMTGKYPARLHLTDYIPGKEVKEKLEKPQWQQSLPLEEVTIAEVLKRVGYATGHFGKWHLNEDKEYALGRPGDPGSQGFDDVLTTHKPKSDDDPNKDAHHVKEITDRAIAFMRKHKAGPFFCYVTHNSIHRPLHERKALVDKYKAKGGVAESNHDPVVGAMVETLDRSVGRLLGELDGLQIADRTLVIYYSDNGCMWGPEVLKPLRGRKGQLYEGGIRVPMVVRWPGVVKAKTTSDEVVSSIDFYLTLSAAAGAKVTAKDIDGLNLMPVLRGDGGLDREAIYWHYPHYHALGMAPGGAIRAGRYKLIEWYEKSLIEGVDAKGALSLYDLAADAGERRDLVEERPALAKRLYGQLAAWRKSVGAQEMTVR